MSVSAVPRGRGRRLGVVAAALVAAGCAGSGSSPAVQTAATGARSPSTAVRATAAPAPTRAPDRALPTLPRGSRTLLPHWRVVAFYGAAGAPALGVLGSGPPEQVWSRLHRQAAAYETKARPVLPAFELIATVAQRAPGRDGRYRSHVPGAVLDRYLAAARRHRALLVLDVQPGRADFLPEVQRLRRWLVEPDVALALDPEWHMGPGEVPGERIGSVDAAEVNRVSGWLDELAAAHRLPQKLLLIHQFTATMVTHKSSVVARRHLATVFNMDGFGSPAAKLAKYRLLADDVRFPLGLKLFYAQDVGLMTPHRVVGLRPPPAVVEYQ